MAMQMRILRAKGIRFKRKFLRLLFLGALATTIITEIVVLTPSSLEENKSNSIAVDPSTLVLDDEPTVVPGVPKGRIAEYSIETFKYVSIQNGEKQWRIEAQKAFMYNPERLVHSRVVQAYIFDPDGKITTITGNESRYFLNKKDLEVYGNVKTIFPDGFELYSDYLQYKPNEKRIIIPTSYPVEGLGHENIDQSFRFKSLGLDYKMSESKIVLPLAARVTLLKSASLAHESVGVPDSTTIESDHCFIDRNKNFAHFTMDPRKPLKNRFVHITQPTLFTRSRWADLTYGNFSQVLQYLSAFEDVLIKEISTKNPDAPPSLRYATAGRADFDTDRDVIVLTQLPQAYQDQDTVTGDIILLHRDSDIIEVEHSNAFSKGE